MCLGLDPKLEKLPEHLKSQGIKGFRTFLMELVDSTADIVLAYKPNIAFYEFDAEAEQILQEVTAYIHHQYPEIPVIVDAKRGDIANTNLGYAQSFWERYQFDATTVHNYLGPETYPPFLNTPGKGIISMCKTSNPDSAFYQDLVIDLATSLKDGLITSEEMKNITKVTGSPKAPLYFIVAYRHGLLSQKNPNIGIVVGATHPECFEPVRKLFGDGPILIPGIGTQGGSLELTLKFAPNRKGQGMIINSGSSIIFADSTKDFAKTARQKTLALHQQIVAILK